MQPAVVTAGAQRKRSSACYRVHLLHRHYYWHLCYLCQFFFSGFLVKLCLKGHKTLTWPSQLCAHSRFVFILAGLPCAPGHCPQADKNFLSIFMALIFPHRLTTILRPFGLDLWYVSSCVSILSALLSISLVPHLS